MIKIVIVEDENLVRQGLMYTVDWGALDCVIVGEACDGLQGIDVILETCPDLVITDVKMPNLDGINMIKQLLVQKCKSQFIILTAFNDFTYAQTALKLGVADYLLKPFDDNDLVNAINLAKEKLIDRKKDKEDVTLIRMDLEKGSKSKYIEDAIFYIRENYASDISVSSTSKAINLSEGYLIRLFKKETGYTFNNYVSNYRIHMAMKLLKDHHTKVYEVSELVGFSDTTYFSSLFKKKVGISPSEYQDRCL